MNDSLVCSFVVVVSFSEEPRPQLLKPLSITVNRVAAALHALGTGYHSLQVESPKQHVIR